MYGHIAWLPVAEYASYRDESLLLLADAGKPNVQAYFLHIRGDSLAAASGETFTIDDLTTGDREIESDTPRGLAAGVWTRHVKRAHRVARKLRAGTVWINPYRALTYNSPLRGSKESGIGRANGRTAIGANLQTKSVWCELSEEVQDPFVLRI